MRFCVGRLLILPGILTQNDVLPSHGPCRHRDPCGGDLQGIEVQQAGLLPVTERDWADAHLINAALEVHADDPALRYRFIADKLSEHGIVAGENRVPRLCSLQGIWSVFAKKRGLNRKPGPPVHDDFVKPDFTASKASELWLTDITVHPSRTACFTFARSKTCIPAGLLVTQWTRG